jgi:LmbE family N-acetylglucosaminyl deacetylase
MARMLVVVAHPDDETLWGAGRIMQWSSQGAAVNVVCCSKPKKDPERAERFLQACGVLGAHGVVLDAIDRGAHEPLALPSWGAEMFRDFDWVLTHNSLGEYGHPHHKQVHEFVYARAVESPLMYFGREAPQPMKYQLTYAQIERKLAALKCYDHTSCTDKKPKWEALVDRYFGGNVQRLGEESYVYCR